MKKAPAVRTANRPTTNATSAARDDRHGKGEVRASARQHGQAGEHVAADAEQSRVTEGHQSGARDEVEAERQDREDRRFGDELLDEEAGHALPDERHNDERDPDRPSDEGAAHHDQPDTVKRRAGIRPLGRKMRTSAMTR